jgi:transposase
MADGVRRRRRRWSASQKRAIMAETLVPGASVAAVAQRHEVNANLLFKWLREAGHGRGEASGAQDADETGSFVSLGIVSDAAVSGGPLLELPSPPPRRAEPAREAGVIEIDVAGARVRVDGDVETAALRRVLRVLKELA